MREDGHDKDAEMEGLLSYLPLRRHPGGGIRMTPPRMTWKAEKGEPSTMTLGISCARVNRRGVASATERRNAVHSHWNR